MKIEPRTLKGFRDYAPSEQLARQEMFKKIQTVFERFGFLPLSTPVLEYKEILMGKYGDDEKLVYSFKDNGDRDVAMRYDLTVPLARYVAQNQGQLTYPFKRYQIAPVWRAENTQKGRLREFYQCDIDVVGSNSNIADAEVMACICIALQTLGIDNYELRFNDRRIFNFLARLPEETNYLTDVIRAIDKIEKIGQDGVIKVLEDRGVPSVMLDRVLKFVKVIGLTNEVISATDLDSDSMGAVSYISETMKRVVAFGVPEKNVQFNQTIARGLDYYTGTVFEIVLKDNSEFGSIAGGGRYDGLLDTFSDKSLPAVGGSIGIDRLFEALESLGKVPTAPGVEVVALNLGTTTFPEVLRVTAELRGAGVNVDVYYDEAKMEKQFKYAESKGAKWAVIIGEEEQKSGTVKLKNLQTREQMEVQESELLRIIKS